MNWKLARRIGFKTLIYFFGVISGAIGFMFWQEWMEERRRDIALENEIAWQRGQVAMEMLRTRRRNLGEPDLHQDEGAYDLDYENHVN